MSTWLIILIIYGLINTVIAIAFGLYLRHLNKKGKI